MDSLYFIFIGIIVLLLIVIVTLLSNRNKKDKVTFEQTYREEEKKDNKRSNFRLRVDVEDTLMEVQEVGDEAVNISEVCEIVDISASGMGIYSVKDYPIRNKVLVKLTFKLNYKDFTLDGVLIRKVELSNKQQIQYGIKFINLSEGDENRLQKEIAAIENSRRKISIR
jgi:c-di-GMP-binding flagellar brake protein YcgR